MHNLTDESGTVYSLGAAQALPDEDSYEHDKLVAQLCGEHDDLSGAELYPVVRIKTDGYQETNTDALRLLWWPAEQIGAVIDGGGCTWAQRDTPEAVLAAWFNGENYDGDGLSR
jgi:hypothetical protein